MNYKVKQQNAKLETWYICHKLGIKYNEWVDVRNNRRNLSKERLDLFNELTYKNANEWINQADEKHKIDEWYENNTTESLKEKIREFGTNQLQIAKELGCDASIVCNVIKTPEKNSQIKYLLYYYLTDEFNKRTGTRVLANGRLQYIDNDKKVEPSCKIKTNKMPSNNAIKKHLEERLKEENEQIHEELENAKEEKDDKDDKEEIWYEEYQKMANKYHDTKEELERYRFLIDEIRKRDDAIQGLGMLLIEKE